MDDNSLKVGSNEMELVDFRIFKQEDEGVYEGIYGINVSKVKEIIRMPILTELPGTPTFIEGIFDLRDVVIPVINLADWMGINQPPEKEETQVVIITEFNNILVGFIVHEAKRIRRINWEDIEPATYVSGDIDGSKITGVTMIEDDNVLLILDLESVVEELGLYRPVIEDVPDDIEIFSGIALAVDDSMSARKIVAQALRKMGFKVMEAKDGQDGLEKMESLYKTYGDDLSKHLKMIISDVEMPRMDGFHFVDNLKQDERFVNIPVAFNSSISDHFSEGRGETAGADGYLVKFDANTFYDEVSRIIRTKNRGE